MRSPSAVPGSRGEILGTIALVAGISAPVLIGAVLGARRKFHRVAAESGGQPLPTDQTAGAVVSGAAVGGLLGAALTATVASIIAVRG